MRSDIAVPSPYSAPVSSERDLAKAETMALNTSGQEASRLPSQQRVGPYQIVRLIGRGGVGAVYQARVVESCALPVGRQVALKILRQDQLSESDHRRFTREAAYLQALSHHGITRIYDVGEHQSRPYLVMELIRGRSLDDILHADRHQPLPVDHACDVVIQACEALHVAHLAGITHRDLKPGNLMITAQGEVKILDFGMAQRISGESRLTASGSILGTPAYMSPEQARGHREWIGSHSDIYALGAVLYELVTGCQPFRAENSVAVLRAIIEDPLPSPRELVPDLPIAIETIIMRAMAKDPRDRYSHAEVMAEDLRRFRRGQRPLAGRIPWWRPWWRRVYFYRRSIAAAALGAFLLVMLAIASLLAVLRDPVDESDPLLPVVIDPTPQEVWIAEWQHPERLGDSIIAAARWIPGLGPGEILYTPVNPDNRDVAVSVEADIRISFHWQRSNGSHSSRVLFSDRAIGEGYALVLGETLALQRYRSSSEDADLVTVATYSQPLPDQALRITIIRRGSTITISYEKAAPTPILADDDNTSLAIPETLLERNPNTVIEYTDLIPFEGTDHGGIHFHIDPERAYVWDITIERKPRSELVSRLELGDALRQAGEFQQAERFYRDFLRDFPDSQRARDARYRRALCLVAMGRDNEALNVFLQVAQHSDDDPLYAVSATFQAWQSALRLGRFREAERYFDVIRSRYDLDTLQAFISQDILAAMPQRYLETARNSAYSDPYRAVRLYDSAAELGAFLGNARVYSSARLGSGDVLTALGEWDEAQERYQLVEESSLLRPEQRWQGSLHLAKMLRLQGQYAQSAETYRTILADPVVSEDQLHWAQLWYGDLLAASNQHQAAHAQWQDLADLPTVPGAIAANLAQRLGEVPLQDATDRANDIAYFNAVAAILAADRDRFEEWFLAAMSLSDPYSWPLPLLQNRETGEITMLSFWNRYPPRQGLGERDAWEHSW
ncbi:MAG: serine/threonine protein kinase [Planctomycetota bacterium]|nr:MAG: serine/threonine protein kinase [Planctomycetota bacterium]